MKKVFITVLTAILLFIGVDEAKAFSAEFVFEGNTTGLVGDELTVNAYVDPTDVPLGVGTLGGFLEFDNTILEYVSSTSNIATGLTFLDNPADLKFAMIDFTGGTKAPTTKTLLYTFKFEVLQEGTTSVGFRELEIGDSGATAVPSTVVPLNVTTVGKSTNANLSGITVGSYTLTPEFNSSVLTYNVSVPYLTTSVNVGATLEDSKASLTGTGNKSLSVGNNPVTLKVTAQNGTVKNYTINITREADTRSTDNNLSALSIDGQTISPTFSASITTYNVTVLNDITSVTVNAVKANDKATVSITGGTNLVVGNNTITIKVTAENGSVKNYTINVTRQAVPKDDDTKLGSLNITGFNLTPTFNPNTNNYSLTVSNDITRLDISAVANSATSTVVINNKDLVVGSNTITITVTAENGDIETYTITVIREEKVIDSNNNLSSLSVDGFDITPTFNQNELNYSMVVPFGITELTVNAVAESNLSSVTVVGNTNLQVGQNVIKINVEAENGSVKEYTITVTKEAEEIIVLDNNANLESLIIKGHDFTPSFSQDETVYILNVDNDITSLDIEAIASSLKATITITGADDLKEGINSIKITVKAEDSSTKNYIINVNRKAKDQVVVANPLSSDNYLNDLTIGGFKIDFYKNINNYTLEIPFEVSTLDINFVKSSNSSVVTINGNGNFIINQVTPIEITVKAEDSSIRIYTINVTRSALSSDNKLEYIKIDGNLIGGFHSDIITYDITTTNNNINLEAMAFNADANITGLGYFDLNEGTNTFLISVEDENSFIRYYQVNVIKEVNESMLMPILLWGGIGLSLLIIMIILIILVRKKPVTEIARREYEPIVQPQAPAIDFKPEFNFGSKNGSENKMEYLATEKLLQSTEPKVDAIPYDPYDDIVTKEEIIDAINNKDSETLKVLYEQEMLNRKKEEIKKAKEDDEWII